MDVFLAEGFSEKAAAVIITVQIALKSIKLLASTSPNRWQSPNRALLLMMRSVHVWLT